MNIQATKLELMQLILESKNKDLLNSLLEIVRDSAQSKKRVKLSEEEKQAAKAGLDDFKNGKYVDFETFMKEFK